MRNAEWRRTKVVSLRPSLFLLRRALAQSRALRVHGDGYQLGSLTSGDGIGRAEVRAIARRHARLARAATWVARDAARYVHHEALNVDPEGAAERHILEALLGCRYRIVPTHNAGDNLD